MAEIIADTQIANALIEKHNQAMREYDQLQELVVTAFERCRVNFVTLRDLSAAGRVFGLDLTEPEKNARIAAEQFYLSTKARALRANSKTTEIVDYSDLLREERLGSVPDADDDSEDRPVPRIRDIVLDRLKLAGAAGTRAAPIRAYIKERYGRDIHEKTVGMTLYRLSNDDLAHRVGITWFFGPASVANEEPRR